MEVLLVGGEGEGIERTCRQERWVSLLSLRMEKGREIAHVRASQRIHSGHWWV